MMKWIDLDLSGVLFFSTKKAALERWPQSLPVRVETTFFNGWAALDPYGSENGCTLYTPDGRQIPRIIWGWSNKGCLMAMRGSTIPEKYWQEWRAITARAIESEIAVKSSTP